MFAIISRGSSRARNAYICSSCLGHVEPQVPRLSRTANATATFSTTSTRWQAEEGGNNGGKDQITTGDAANGEGKTEEGVQGENKAVRRRASRRMAARRKEQARNLLKKHHQTGSGGHEDASGTISNSAEALDALRKSMLAEVSGEFSAPDKGLGEEPAVNGNKKVNGVKTAGKKAVATSKERALSSKAAVTSNLKSDFETKEDALVAEIKDAVPNPTTPKKGKATKKTVIATKPAKSKKSSTVSPTTKTKKPASPLEVRKIATKDSKDAIIGQKLKISRTPSTDNAPLWAKKWIDAIASNQDGGSGFKRAILLKLIEKGNLSPKDVGPAVTLLRNAIQEDQKRIEFQSLKQDEFQTLKQAMQGGSATEDKPSSGPRISRHPSKGSPMTPIKPRSKKAGEEKREKTGGSDAQIKGMTKHEIKAINASDLKLVPLDTGPLEVPKLSYGLERVLFNPGVYQLQDPRSRVFNFDPYLQTIMPVSEFDFNALKEYITSSRDANLLGIAKAEKRKYTGSTSSMTSALGHFHFLLSQWRPINAGILSRNFPVEFSSFTLLQRGPTAIFLRYKDGVYAIDADKEFDTANILSSLGKSMEKLLTLPTNEFERYRKPNSDQITEEERNEDEAFHYTTMGDFLMRSQLDAYDPRLPGTGMFDLKTRAVVSIRMDTSKYEEGSGYEIKQRHGEWESFEREYYDMIRAAFLKYSLQVRMGRMDGIFVAFHNTERIFGFQYVSLSEMDYALHGTDDTTIGDSEFKLSLDLLNRVLDRATAKYPEKSLRLFFETREADTPFMYIFAEPVEENEIDEIQTSNKAEIEEFESRVLGLAKEETEEEKQQAEWDSLYSKVEETMDKDESGLVVDEEDGIDDNRSDSEVWDEEERRKVEDFIKTAAQEDGSQDEEDDDEDGDDSELMEVEDEEGDKDDGVVEDQDEGEDQENELAEDEEVEEESEENEDGEEEIVEESELEMDEQSQESAPDEQDNHMESSAEETTLGESEFVPDEQENHIEEQETTLEKDLEKSEDGTVEQIISDADETAREEQAQLVEEGVDKFSEAKGGNSSSLDDKTANSDASQFKNNTLFTLPEKPARIDADSSTTDEAITPESETSEEDQIFAMTLTIRNKVNGKYVQRPNGLTSDDNWTVEYSLAEVKEPVRARKLYNMAKERRAKTLRKSTKKNSSWNTEYVNSLMKLASKGRQWRKEVDEVEKGVPKKVLDIRDVGEGKAGKE